MTKIIGGKILVRFDRAFAPEGYTYTKFVIMYAGKKRENFTFSMRFVGSEKSY